MQGDTNLDEIQHLYFTVRTSLQEHETMLCAHVYQKRLPFFNQKKELIAGVEYVPLENTPPSMRTNPRQTQRYSPADEANRPQLGQPIDRFNRSRGSDPGSRHAEFEEADATAAVAAEAADMARARASDVNDDLASATRKLREHKQNIENIAWKQLCNVHLITATTKAISSLWHADRWDEKQKEEVATFEAELHDYEEHGGRVDDLNIDFCPMAWELFKLYWEGSKKVETLKRSLSKASDKPSNKRAKSNEDEHGDSTDDEEDEHVARRLAMDED